MNWRALGLAAASLSIVASASRGYAAPYDQRLESRTTAGVLGNGMSDWPQLNADGRYIAFTSLASNLTPALPTNGTRHVFRRDVNTPQTILIDFEFLNLRAANGNAGLRAFINADGRFVVFDHDSPNVVAGDTNGVRDVFVRDTATSTTERISLSSAGAQGNADSVAGAISPDGRFVVFTSLATNLVPGDTNAVKDVFLHDRVLKSTVRVSVDSAEDQGNGACADYPWIGGIPQYVVFSSLATDLVAGDTNAVSDVFIRLGGGVAAGWTERVSVDSLGAQANGASYAPVVSRNGGYVAFHSSASNLVPADGNGAIEDVFRKNRVTGVVDLASVSDGGAQEFGPAQWPSISQDGRNVAYHAYGQYEAADTNFVFDVYARNFTTLNTSLISRQSALGLVGNSLSMFCGISAEAKFVAFASDATNLVPADVNTVRDVFRYEYGKLGAKLVLMLDFRGWAGPRDPAVLVEMRPVNGGDWVLFDPQPDPPGQYLLEVQDLVKSDFLIKCPKFLVELLPALELKEGDIQTYKLRMRGGDVDEDNAITVYDYNILSEYFDKSSADTDWRVVGKNGWAPMDADVDGDGSVNVYDYNMISANFDEVGGA